MTRLAVRLATVALVVLAAGCGSPRLTRGDQPRVTSPIPLEIVTTPFTVSWTAPTDRASRYAVFVDQRPIAPGHELRELADDQCRRLPSCPDATYLGAHGVYVADETHVEVKTLPPLGGVAGQADHPAHVLRVVALDAEGRRRGEASWEVEVRG